MKRLDSMTDSTEMNWSELWEIPWAEEPGQLESMGLQRVGHNLATEQQQNIEWRSQ